MAQNDVSLKVTAKDEASGTLNKIAGNINQFANNTKKSTSGLTQLGSSLKNLKNAVPGIGLVAGAVAGVTAAVKKVIASMSEWEQAWAKVEQSATKLDIAGRINENLQGTSYELKKFASDLSSSLKNTISGGDIMEAMSTFAFDKTADQIKNMASAGADLAKAMGTDLNSAMSMLNNTFSGTVGQLGKMFPELKKLSKEELEAGKAVEIVKGKLDGVAQALDDTTSGSMQRYKNSMGDLKEELGAAVTGFFSPLRNWLSDIASGWAESLKRKREYNEYKMKFDEGARDEGTLTGFVDSSKLKVEELRKLQQADKEDAMSGGMYYDYYQQQINEILTNIKSSEIMLQQEKKKMAEQELLEKARQIQEEKKLAQEKLEAERKALKDQEELRNQDFIKTITADNKKAAANAEIARLEQEIANKTRDEAIIIKEILKLQDENYKKASAVDYTWAVESQKQAAEYMLNKEKEIADKLAKERSELADKEKKEREKYIEGLRQQITGKMGETGTLIEGAFSGDWTSVLVNYAGQILSKVVEFSSIVDKVFNFVSSAAEYFIQPLAQVVENVVGPMLPIVKAMGQTVGVILQLLEPISKYIIGPVMKVLSTTIVTVLGSIYNAVVAVHNFFVRKKYEWAYMDIAGAVKEIWDDSSSASASGAGSAATGRASYTAARDIYININYNNSYINGDAMEIALNIRDKIKEAERMGY